MRVEETGAALGMNTRAIARFRQSSSDHPKRSSKLSCGHTVEFALHPQHETSLDSGIQIIKDFNYFKSKSRKRPRSLSMVSLNSNDWEEYWNTKVIPQNEFKSKSMKLERNDD